MTIIDIKLDFECESLRKIVEALSVQDEEIRVVGGAVRDKILGIKPTDIDLITTLSPKNSLKLLRNAKIATIPTGIKFGTITAFIDGKNFEITTLREDSHCDGRHAKVVFTKDFKKDAERRDFTINSMSYDLKNNKLYDYFNGYGDLQNRIVKFIGQESLRIKEDYLRILRFFRFSAKYANHIDEKGLLSCIEQKRNIQLLSPERIISELNKMLQSEGSLKILDIMKENDIFMEISRDLTWDIESYKSFLSSAPRICPNILGQLEIHYISLLHKNVWSVIQGELFRLRLSNREIRKIYYLKYYYDMIIDGADSAYVIKLNICEKKTNFFSLISYLLSSNILEEKEAFEFIEKYKNKLDKEIPITGQDFLDRGISGEVIGIKLQKAKELWIESDFKSSKEVLLKKVS